jgi:YD repeat-containing protein
LTLTRTFISSPYWTDIGLRIEDRYYKFTDAGLASLPYTTDASYGVKWQSPSDNASANYYETTTTDWRSGRGVTVWLATGSYIQTTDPLGTITQKWFDRFGRPTDVLVGSQGPNYYNLVTVASHTYNGPDQDGTLNSVILHPDGQNSAKDRVTSYFYDWRDRQVGSISGSTISYSTLDNLDQVLATSVFDGGYQTQLSGPAALPVLSLTDANGDGIPDAPDGQRLRAETDNLYDSRGAIYESRLMNVSQTDGTKSGYLASDFYHDARGDLIATRAPGGLWTKSAYDGAGRMINQYATDGAGGTSWSAASSIAADTVLNQQHFDYDADGNLIFSVNRDRLPVGFGTGPLGGPDGNVKIGDSEILGVDNMPAARVSYKAFYYDAADRLTTTVDVGTHGGNEYSRPADPDARSALVLVTSQTYDSAGNVDVVTDPRNISTKRFYDGLGRVKTEIDGYTGGNGDPTVDDNRRTWFEYDGLDHTTVAAQALPGGGTRKTEYIYDTGQGSNKDLLTLIKYPADEVGDDGKSLANEETFEHNALGEVTKRVDRYGATHQYSYDNRGNLVGDFLTFPPGSPADKTIAKRSYAYDALGRPYLFTSEGNAGGRVNWGPENQVKRVYDGLGRLTDEFQSHEGAVMPDSPDVHYTYDSNLAHGNRLLSVTYPKTANDPNGYTLLYQYDAGLDDRIGRLSGIAEQITGAPSNPLEPYTYLGLSTVASRSYSEIGLIMTLDPGGDGSMTGLDAFGRPIDVNWQRGGSADHIQYTYDADGNVLTRYDAVGNQTYTYDLLNRIKTFNSDQSGGEHETWTYNAKGEPTLAAVFDSGALRTDASGNVFAGDAGGTMWRSAGGDSPDTRAETFDAWGDLTDEKTNRRATAQPVAWSGESSYDYDALGRRIRETNVSPGGDPHELYYTADNRVIDDGVSRYVWSAGAPGALILADTATDGRLYAVTDAQNSVTETMQFKDATGQVTNQIKWRFAYDPNGIPEVTNSTKQWTGQRPQFGVLFHGMRYDANADLYDAGSGAFDPWSGHSVQPDPGAYLTARNAYLAGSYNPGQVQLHGWGWRALGVVNGVAEAAGLIALGVLAPPIGVAMLIGGVGYEGYAHYGEGLPGVGAVIGDLTGINSIRRSFSDDDKLDDYDRGNLFGSGVVQLEASAYGAYRIASSPKAQMLGRNLLARINPANWEFAPNGLSVDNEVTFGMSRIIPFRYSGPRWTRTTTPWQRIAYQRKDIDWDFVRPEGAERAGLTNWEAAKAGYAPVRASADGRIDLVVLHHLNEDPYGAVAELWRTTHGAVPHQMEIPWRQWRPDWAVAWGREQSAYWRWTTGKYNPTPTERLPLPR